ncbi:hypothetical protein DACRYDRAFT_103793 [Dacryopinax primogenitus]|uniref:Uncharacterized protein n=1 Tax=Dacryopinax primogenitus (strain DJM 731) TaxID=1858805 RepID=M5GAD5_DACPD|nr:uncharacterized protein DACRYDRAFT_103793 [Dacryopinax primogenitus]EJU05300.1 hypothetical protein DACRYDRAFT_103793 [Dacryopinax primogenitus]
MSLFNSLHSTAQSKKQKRNTKKRTRQQAHLAPDEAPTLVKTTEAGREAALPSFPEGLSSLVSSAPSTHTVDSISKSTILDGPFILFNTGTTHQSSPRQHISSFGHPLVELRNFGRTIHPSDLSVDTWIESVEAFGACVGTLLSNPPRIMTPTLRFASLMPRLQNILLMDFTSLRLAVEASANSIGFVPRVPLYSIGRIVSLFQRRRDYAGSFGLSHPSLGEANTFQVLDVNILFDLEDLRRILRAPPIYLGIGAFAFPYSAGGVFTIFAVPCKQTEMETFKELVHDAEYVGYTVELVCLASHAKFFRHMADIMIGVNLVIMEDLVEEYVGGPDRVGRKASSDSVDTCVTCSCAGESVADD